MIMKWFKQLLSDTSTPARSAPKLPEDWGSYLYQTDDNLPASNRLNLALHDLAPLAGMDQRTWITLKLRQPNEHGLTAPEEYPAICKIEDDITDALVARGAVMVGSVTGHGQFSLIFYSPDTQDYDKIIDGIMKSYGGYEYSYHSEADPEWEAYLRFLYPDAYEYQFIVNRKIWTQLEQQGNLHEVERAVDHWLHFPTADDVKAAASEAEGLGYTILALEQVSDGSEYPHQLNISRHNNTLPNEIDEYVHELMVLAEKNNGCYDGWGCVLVTQKPH